VRLLRGDFEAETVYGDDPVAVARDFEHAGVEWMHTVDLDAARTGDAHNLDAIGAVCRGVDCKVQAGGGVRSAEAADALFGAGVERVVLGTAAVEQPELVEQLCRTHPGRIAVGLDARGRSVAVRGWAEESGDDLLELAARFEGIGVAALIVTSISRDGTFGGPDVEQLDALLGAVLIPLIASGGVGSLDDLRTLQALEVSGNRLAGAIVGRALYEGRVDVREAVHLLR
jgi:phosphoribosylformimino-5-aminoimidazole carboxamide ribotide isomerase